MNLTCKFTMHSHSMKVTQFLFEMLWSHTKRRTCMNALLRNYRTRIHHLNLSKVQLDQSILETIEKPHNTHQFNNFKDQILTLKMRQNHDFFTSLRLHKENALAIFISSFPISFWMIKKRRIKATNSSTAPTQKRLRKKHTIRRTSINFRVFEP